MKIKENLKRLLGRIKKIYIHICKFISDTFHGKADGSLVNWFAILFVIGASIILPVSMGTAYYSYIGLVIVAEIVYFISIILLFSCTILFDRKKVTYWISDILLLIRYITLIDIGSEWNKQFSIAYVGVLIIYFVSLLSLSSAKHINYKGGKIDTIIFAIGLACFLIGIITSQSESIYSKILILTGIVVIYLYAISRVLFWIFFAKEKVKFNLLKTMGCIVLFVGLIIAVPFILEYAGISPEVIKEVIVPIYAAGVGGILALAGVAWTIKNGERVREDDERKKYFPYIKLANVNNSDYSISPKIIKIVNPESDIERLDHNIYFMYKFNNFAIKNIAESVFILESILINENDFGFLNNTTLEKDSISLVKISDNTIYYCSWDPLKTISLIFKDIMGNRYKAKCSYKSKRNEPSIEHEIQDKKYVCITYNIEIKDILLPELMQEEK